MIRLYVILGALALLIGAGVYVVQLQKKAERLESSNATLTATLASERAARAHELKIATEASHDYESRLQALSVARADTPVQSVRLCRSPTGWVPAPSPAPSGTGPGSDAGHAGEAGSDLEAGPDIGPALYALADEKDEELARCASLIKWVKSR